MRTREGRVGTRLGAVALAALALTTAALAGTPAAAEGPGTRGKVAGFGVTTSDGGDRAITAEAGRIAATGGNTVMLEATWYIDCQTCSDIRPSSSTVSDQALLVAAQRVRAAGMNVMFTIKIVCDKCTGGQANSARWRGSLRPEDEDAFFESYRNMSNRYAMLAQQAGAVLYFVGSEMNTLQGKTEQWRRVVFEARSRFGGRLGYQVNWNALRGVDWWDEVDVAGVSAYFPLSDEQQPTIPDLLAAWKGSQAQAWKGRNWLGDLQAFAKSHGKPVLFGEIGYQSAAQAMQRPFVQEKTETYDPQLQADGYQAVLTTFEDQPWWLGVIWWEWKMTGGGDRDMDYSPRGKLAEELVTRWYAGERPPRREAALVGTDRAAPAPAKTATSPQKAAAPTAPKTRPAPVTSGGAVAPGPAGAGAPAPQAPETPAPDPATAGATPDGEATAEAAPGVREPSVLAEIPAGTLADAIARADERRRFRYASYGAGGLAAAVLLGHGLVAVRRNRRDDIFSALPGT